MSSKCRKDIVGLIIRGCLGSIPTGGNILPLDFFHVVKPLMSILPILSIYEKLEWILIHGWSILSNSFNSIEFNQNLVILKKSRIFYCCSSQEPFSCNQGKSIVLHKSIFHTDLSHLLCDSISNVSAVRNNSQEIRCETTFVCNVFLFQVHNKT